MFRVKPCHHHTSPLPKKVHVAPIVSRTYASHTYQKTLNLPRTKFPIKSNLQKTYQQLIPQSSQQLYREQLDRFLQVYWRKFGSNNNNNNSSDDAKKLEYIKRNLFILHDGPPYANGDLHLGHALNKILKDIVNRYQLSQGKAIFYKPGWDCHGLPIELKALKELTGDQVELISPGKIRRIAETHALKAQLKQKRQFEKFAILTDWESPYLTLNKKFEINQLKVFQKLYNLGLIKRQSKPVFWGTETRTALAESELEYNERHESVSAYVKFPLTSSSTAKLLSSLKIDLSGQNPKVKPESQPVINCLIWTSTPWTLFSNQGICFNDSFKYSLLRLTSTGDLVIVGTDLIDQLGIPLGQYQIIVSQFDGTLLDGLTYTNPLVDPHTKYPLLHGPHVTNVTGTGLVHTAPGHGPEDYLIGVRNHLPIFSPVDHRGNYDLSQFPRESIARRLLSDPTNSSLGRNVLDPETTRVILNQLTDSGMLFKSAKYVHSYPYDWRSKKPVIIRSTPQWFTNLEDLKKLALDSLTDVKFYPERGRHRLESFIRNRNEWCISRQRSWGVPIPYFQHRENPDVILIDNEIITKVIERIGEVGIDAWFSEAGERTSDIKEWLPEKYHAVAHEFHRGRDTMDVWFDSGTSWTVIEDFYREQLGISPESLDTLNIPMSEVYLEGSDQHRGWFQSSLLTKVGSSEAGSTSAAHPRAPFATIITHGFTLDENGIKMSKSIGNTISPQDIIEGNPKLQLPALGVDGLRYLVAQTDFTSDISAGPTVLNRAADALKKLRLSFKFLLSNLGASSDFKLLPLDQLRRVDRYTISKLDELLRDSRDCYECYNFSKVLTTLQRHLNKELSSFYYDISKDALYSDSLGSLRRRQIQTTLFHILDTYRAILSPILPILVQDVWNYLPKEWLNFDEGSPSPMVRKWPQFCDLLLPTYEHEIKSFERSELSILRIFKEQFKELTKENITKTGQVMLKLFYEKSSPLPFSSEEITDILQVEYTEIIPLEAGVSIDDVPGVPLRVEGDQKIKVVIERSPLHECPRCWKHNSVEEGKLCSRCDQVLTHLK